MSRHNPLIRPRDRTGAKPRTVRKAAVKVCPKGHRQAWYWSAGDVCWVCAALRHEEERAGAVQAEREAWGQAHGGAKVLEIRVVSTGRVKRYSIPRGQGPVKARRGRRRRRRI